jgi:hypothetical protein
MRFYAVADFTYHNAMALHYGIASDNDNMDLTSHFSLTSGITNFTIDSRDP